MLILSRKINESIVVGENIRIKILDVKGNTVKIGIIAPEEVSVLRDELYTKVANQNVKASDVNSSILEELSKKI